MAGFDAHLAVLDVKDKHHGAGNISGYWIEAGSENGKVKFSSKKHPNHHIHWTGQKWSLTVNFNRSGHDFGSGEWPKHSTGGRMHLKIMQAGSKLKHESEHAPVPQIHSMVPNSVDEPLPKKCKSSDTTVEHSEVLVDMGKVEFLWNHASDTGKVPPVNPDGGKGFKWQSMGRLYWDASGAMYGCMGVDRPKEADGYFSFEGHINNESTQDHPADRKFILYRPKKGQLPDIMEGTLPSYEKLEHTVTQNSPACEFKLSVTMPPEFPVRKEITCIVFKSEMHHDKIIRAKQSGDADHSSNAFDRDDD